MGEIDKPNLGIKITVERKMFMMDNYFGIEVVLMFWTSIGGSPGFVAFIYFETGLVLYGEIKGLGCGWWAKVLGWFEL
ncbi:MAG: hypothetical protein DRO11_09790 [Methanobacteriota archaeon]|nr:MAG: hypothetical protein DRO11_09790 [Euryarchaeota archaeon]